MTSSKCRSPFFYFILSVLTFCLPLESLAVSKIKGIYINQGTMENTPYLRQLISESKLTGINTFVIDLAKVTPQYKKNIQLVKANNLRYVARIVIFPDGGRASQIHSQTYWEQKFQLVKNAIALGADEIQLDYIRYSSKQPASPQNARDIKKVVQWFKNKLQPYQVPLQIDIFGEVAFKPSEHIGQNILILADSIDSVSPMVYPSHYHPYQKHSREPYKIIYSSLKALKKQFDNKTPFKIVPFIEASNYHYKMPFHKKSAYILEQIKAVEDAQVDGWYVWSPKNIYNSLFHALKNRNAINAKGFSL